MINCLNNHVEEAVVKGWYMLFIMIEAMFGLIFSVFVVLYLTISPDGEIQWALAIPIIPSIALTMYATLSREKENIKLVKTRAHHEDIWISLASEVLTQSASIKGYGKQEEVAKEFKSEYETFYTVHRKHRKFEMKTGWVCHWYNGITYYTLLALGPILIIGVIPASKFVILVKLYRSIDKYTGLLSDSISNLQRASIALDEVRDILNLPSQGHEVGALDKAPTHLDSDGDYSWSLNEVISLATFIFGNNKDPHAHHLPNVILQATQKAKEATKVLKTSELIHIKASPLFKGGPSLFSQ